MAAPPAVPMLLQLSSNPSRLRAVPEDSIPATSVAPSSPRLLNPKRATFCVPPALVSSSTRPWYRGMIPGAPKNDVVITMHASRQVCISGRADLQGLVRPAGASLIRGFTFAGIRPGTRTPSPGSPKPDPSSSTCSNVRSSTPPMRALSFSLCRVSSSFEGGCTRLVRLMPGLTHPAISQPQASWLSTALADRKLGRWPAVSPSDIAETKVQRKSTPAAWEQNLQCGLHFRLGVRR
jgi:hypothetical protein